MVIASAVAVTAFLLVVGGLSTEAGPWYRALAKPVLQPPAWVFAPAWTAILALSAAAFVLAWRGAPDAAGQGRVALLFGANAVLHLLWSPLFFKAKRPDWALAEIPLLFLSIIAMSVGYAPYSRPAAWLLLPYAAWVGFAIWLNYGIVRLNGPFGAAVRNR